MAACRQTLWAAGWESGTFLARFFAVKFIRSNGSMTPRGTSKHGNEKQAGSRQDRYWDLVGAFVFGGKKNAFFVLVLCIVPVSASLVLHAVLVRHVFLDQG